MGEGEGEGEKDPRLSLIIQRHTSACLGFLEVARGSVSDVRRELHFVRTYTSGCAYANDDYETPR